MPDRWLAREATTHTLHDLFIATATAVAFTAIPVL
jgi:hypothetical protein